MPDVTAVEFHNQSNPLKLSDPSGSARWIANAVKKEGKRLRSLQIVFCNDKYLLKINKTFLHHNTLTDIITFDYSEGLQIDGELYISIPRIRENAKKFSVTLDEEFHRVMIHGVLHLLGYTDKTTRQKSIMRKKEDAYLSLR